MIVLPLNRTESADRIQNEGRLARAAKADFLAAAILGNYPSRMVLASKSGQKPTFTNGRSRREGAIRHRAQIGASRGRVSRLFSSPRAEGQRPSRTHQFR